MTQYMEQEKRKRCLKFAKDDDNDITLERFYQVNKSGATLFPFKEITHDELEQLFIHEEMSVRRIADLFDVTVGQVNYKKGKLGIYLQDYVNEDYMKKIADSYEEAMRVQEEFYKEREEKKLSQNK